jgi:hypothetical protein
MAVADASFKIEILSMSLGFIKLNGFLASEPPSTIPPVDAIVPSSANGIPSTTNSGLLLDLIEFEPLIRIFAPAPG